MSLTTDLLPGFQGQKISLAAGEVELFNGLIEALKASPSCTVAKYHGTRNLVTFDRRRKDGRNPPCCEISDLLIISYVPGDRSSIRTCWLQAKVAHDLPIAGPCGSFRANLEQWDLLRHPNPEIQGKYSTFQPPKTLLSKAVLKSVGTFGVFYQNHRQWDMAYFIANRLSVLNDHYPSIGTLIFNSNDFLKIDKVPGYSEVLATRGLQDFGRHLDENLIGTPIFPKSGSCGFTTNWLGGVIRSLEKVAGDKRQALDGLIELLDQDLNMERAEPGAKAIAVVQASGVDRQ